MEEYLFIFGIIFITYWIGYFTCKKSKKKQKTVGSLIVNYDDNCLDGPYVLLKLDEELDRLERGSTISLVIEEQI